MGVNTAETQAPYLGACVGGAAHGGIFLSWVGKVSPQRMIWGVAWMEAPTVLFVEGMWDMIPSTQGCLGHLQLGDQNISNGLRFLSLFQRVSSRASPLDIQISV